MEQNVANAPPLTDGSVGSKDQIVKQLTEKVGGDGLIFQQLASNPFFTAVSLPGIAKIRTSSV